MVQRHRHPAVPPHVPRGIVRTDQFTAWCAALAFDRRRSVEGAISLIAEAGPTLGRPRVDVIHGTRLHKLKEARVDIGVRLLFAFDSNRDLVMLLGGDKTGKWNRWYPEKIAQAERLYHEHERRNGKEPPWLNRQPTGRKPPQRGR
jgi:hypothetical protein